MRARGEFQLQQSRSDGFRLDPRNVPPVTLQDQNVVPFAIFHICLFIIIILCFYQQRQQNQTQKWKSSDLQWTSLKGGICCAPRRVCSSRAAAFPPTPQKLS